MKRLLLSIGALVIASAAFSQSTNVNVDLDKQLLEYRFLKDGGMYLQFGKITDLMDGPRNNKEVQQYDASLTRVLTADLSQYPLKAFAFLTPDGSFTGFTSQGKTAFSDQKIYYYAGSNFKMVKDDDNKGSLKDVIKVFNTNKYQVYFGKQKKRKDSGIVDGTEFNDLYFSRRDVNTLALKLIPVKFPAEAFGHGRMFYQYVDHTEDKVYFLLNALENEGKKSNCVLVSFDYDGQLVDNIPFTIALDSGKDFMYHNNPDGINSVEMAKGGSVREIRTEAATVTAKIGKDGFYIPGTSGNLKEGMILGDGFYLCKYDFTGKLLWKIEKTLVNTDKKKKSKGNYYTGDFNMAVINNNDVALWSHESNSDNNFFYRINGADGTMKDTKEALTAVSRELEWSRKRAWAGLQKSVFSLAEKGGDANRFDFATIYAMLYKPEIRQYVMSKKNSKFETHLCPVGIYIMEENGVESGVRLLKFDW